MENQVCCHECAREEKQRMMVLSLIDFNQKEGKMTVETVCEDGKHKQSYTFSYNRESKK